MNNDSTDLLKLVGLDTYDIDKEKTSITTTASETIINLYLKRRVMKCPFCGSIRTVIKETRKKNINHSIKPQQKTTICFFQKKMKCKDCNHSFLEKNPIGDTVSNYSKIQMINSLRNPRRTFLDVANDFFVSVTTVQNYFDKMIDIKRHPLTLVICFDEIYAKHLTKTKYSFCIYDPVSGTLLDLIDARLKNVLENYFIHIPMSERLKVRFVNMDMWPTYVNIAERFLPNATICIDSFHVIKHLNAAMDSIRLKIQRKYADTKDIDKKNYYWIIKSFHYYFVEDFNKITYTVKPKSHYSYLPDKYAVLHELLSIDSDLTEAYYLKEEYREFNLTEEFSENTIAKLEDFIDKFKKSKFEEFIDFGIMLSHWKYYIANSFIRVNGKRMSNGPMESLNGRLKRLLEDGYGYKSFKRFRNRAMFSLNRYEPIKL